MPHLPKPLKPKNFIISIATELAIFFNAQLCSPLGTVCGALSHALWGVFESLYKWAMDFYTCIYIYTLWLRTIKLWNSQQTTYSKSMTPTTPTNWSLTRWPFSSGMPTGISAPDRMLPLIKSNYLSLDSIKMATSKYPKRRWWRLLRITFFD